MKYNHIMSPNGNNKDFGNLILTKFEKDIMRWESDADDLWQPP